MNKYQCGPFGIPNGQATVEVPDGVTKTFEGGVVRNSLTNSDFAHGGPDGAGYGAFRMEDDSNVTSVLTGPDTSRFRVG